MKKYILLFSIFLLFAACEKKGDECAECDKALQHMAGKIANQFCNPVTMAEAWSRITDECGKTYDDNYVGLIAESCDLGATQTPICGHIMSSSQFMDKLKFNYSYSQGLPDDTVVVIINMTSTSKQIDQQIITNESFSEPLPFILYDGENLEITLVHFTRGDTLASETVKFTFARYNNWKFERNIDVQYDQQGQQYIMTLNNWAGQ